MRRLLTLLFLSLKKKIVFIILLFSHHFHDVHHLPFLSPFSSHEQAAFGNLRLSHQVAALRKGPLSAFALFPSSPSSSVGGEEVAARGEEGQDGEVAKPASVGSSLATSAFELLGELDAVSKSMVLRFWCFSSTSSSSSCACTQSRLLYSFLPSSFFLDLRCLKKRVYAKKKFTCEPRLHLLTHASQVERLRSLSSPAAMANLLLKAFPDKGYDPSRDAPRVDAPWPPSKGFSSSESDAALAAVLVGLSIKAVHTYDREQDTLLYAYSLLLFFYLPAKISWFLIC